MASTVILNMMDNIIKDMESKTPEELFNALYTSSSYFREQWDNFANKQIQINEKQTMKEFDFDGRRCSDFQGKLFEQSVTRYNCSSKIFLRRFLKSDVLSFLDKNTVDSIYWSVPEALDVIEQQYGESNYGSVKYPSEAMYWMGYFYRYISYTRSIDTSVLFFHFPPEEVIKKYEVYHTQSMEWAVSSLLDCYNFNESFFDPNWRMKQILINQGYAQNPISTL